MCRRAFRVASSMFQAMGNTLPSLVSSAIRIIAVVVPAWILSRVPGFELQWIWILAGVSVFLQMAISLLLLRHDFRTRLTFSPAEANPEPVGLAAPAVAPHGGAAAVPAP